ncbi:MAG: LuxR C-terminal-related transcriptional regulator [Candidatus Abyssubacteria bacterium]
MAFLEQNRHLPLTLISASAGYGKSTLASQWLDERNSPSAWVSLDETTDDLRIFLSYFITAMESMFPEACRKTSGLLRSRKLPPLPVLSTSLINELDEIDKDFVLVLDNYHCIREQAVHDLLSELLRNPPRCAHIILITRRDPPLPLVNLRAQQKMAEIRVQNLRFMREETAACLEHLLKRNIEETTAAIWTEKTEGWVTGLRLAALSMRHRDNVDNQTLETLSNVQYVTEYLFSEVLSQQPSQIRQTLLNSAILDRFCAPLLEAVCSPDVEPGEDKLNTWNFISFLQKENLFIIQLDAENHWFRFHHSFQQLLQNQLRRYRNPEEIATLHSRASAWLAENGLVEEAIRHALKAGDMASATKIVGRNRQAILDEDKWHSLDKWLAIMPAEVKQGNVELLLAQAWISLYHFDFQAIAAILEKIRKIVDKGILDALSEGEINFFKGFLCYFQGQGPQSEEYLNKAVEAIPEQYRHTRSHAELHYALALHMTGRKEIAVQRINGMLRDGRLSEGVAGTRLWAGLCYPDLLDANLSQAFFSARNLQETASKDKILHAESWGLYMRALIYLLRNDLKNALQFFTRILENPYILHSRVAVDSYAALAHIHQIRERPDKADEMLRLLVEFAALAGDQSFIAIGSSCQAHLSMLRGDMAQAMLCLRTADLTSDASPMLFWWEVPRITECRVLIAEGSGVSLQEAVDKLQKYEHENKAIHNTLQLVNILSLLALAYKKQGRIDEALETLGHAIELAEPGGMIRPFLELGPQTVDLLMRLAKENRATGFIGEILAGFGSESPKAPRSANPSAHLLVEPLTQQEIKILTLLAQRLRNKEIAEKLFISPQTVKRHTINIYQKLGVNSREEAVAKARTLGVLSAL